MKLAGAALALVITLAGASCNYSEQKKSAAPDTGAPAVTDLAWLMKNLFHTACVSCHNGGRQPGGFKFETGADLMSQARTGGINPGNAGTSQIYLAISSGRMPPGANKPAAETVEVLRCWIDAGASESSAQCAPQDGTSGDATPGPGGTPQPQPRPNPPKPGPGDTGGDDDGGHDHDDSDDDGGHDHDDSDDDGGNDDGGAGNGDGGDGTGGDGGTTAPAFAAVNTILAAQCSGCHGDEFPAADVSLTSFSTIVSPATGPQLVVCGNAAASLLYTIVADDSMPMGNEPLPPEQKKTIADWINGGCQP